jgi:hypothetical protein
LSKKNTFKAMKKERKEQEGKPMKFTTDGLKIYTENDLKIGKGGNTELCPFDCDCCF